MASIWGSRCIPIVPLFLGESPFVPLQRGKQVRAGLRRLVSGLCGTVAAPDCKSHLNTSNFRSNFCVATTLLLHLLLQHFATSQTISVISKPPALSQAIPKEIALSLSCGSPRPGQHQALCLTTDAHKSSSRP